MSRLAAPAEIPENGFAESRVRHRANVVSARLKNPLSRVKMTTGLAAEMADG
jgi:hypothetical protein